MKVKGKENFVISDPKIYCLKYAHIKIFGLPRDYIVCVMTKQTLQ